MGLDVDVRALFATPTLADVGRSRGQRCAGGGVPPNRIPGGVRSDHAGDAAAGAADAEEIERIVATVPGGAANVQDIYPLAPLQEGILFHHLMGGDGDPYLLPSLMSFDSRGAAGQLPAGAAGGD